jgi:drug/metabolite transporter (DMT)-like permease
MQRDLIGALGAVGAAQVRFLFGRPIAAMFLVGVMAAIEAPMAQVVSLRMFREPPSLPEALGMTLIVAALSGRRREAAVGSEIRASPARAGRGAGGS